MEETAKKEKSYVIKVPVFTSELFLKGADLFGGVTYDDMNKYVHSKIDEYNSNAKKGFEKSKKQGAKKEIENVVCIDSNIGGRPCILLKISAYNTNLYDGYVETDKKIRLEHDHKVGSDNYFVLLVPNIIGVDKNNYKHQWIILVYEDPHKDNLEIVSTAKLVVNNIISISTSNIKLPEIMEELKRIKKIPELSLNFTSISNDENEVDAKFRSYLVGSKFRKQKEDRFENMPFDTTEDVINDISYEDEYQKRVVKITVGKKEYRITRENKNNAKEKLKEAVEEIFNETIGITESELNEHIYNTEFIIEKLTPVLQNYLA